MDWPKYWKLGTETEKALGENRIQGSVNNCEQTAFEEEVFSKMDLIIS